MSTPVYLDLIAMVAPALSLWLLVRQKPSFVGIARRNLIRLNIYFFLILAADIDRILAQNTIATYIMLIGFFLVAMNFGHAAAVVQFRTLLSASLFHPDSSRNNQVPEEQPLSSESHKIRETISSASRYWCANDIIPFLCLSKHY